MEKIISPQTFFLILKLIDKYNTIYNINNIKQRMTLQNLNKRSRQDTTGIQDVAIINYKNEYSYIDK